MSEMTVHPKWALGAALALAAVGGYLLAGARTSTSTRGTGSAVGTAEATWSCTNAAACDVLRAAPALVFSQGSCPSLTIVTTDGSHNRIRAVLPAGRYRVAGLLADERLMDVAKHSFVTVEAGKVTRLEDMTVKPGAVPYPMFCD